MGPAEDYRCGARLHLGRSQLVGYGGRRSVEEVWGD